MKTFFAYKSWRSGRSVLPLAGFEPEGRVLESPEASPSPALGGIKKRFRAIVKNMFRFELLDKEL